MRAATCVLFCGLAVCVQCGRFGERETLPTDDHLTAILPSEDLIAAGARTSDVRPDPAPTLKAAFLYTGNAGCGFDHLTPEYQFCSAVVRAASREQLLAMYTDVISDPGASSVSSWEIGRVASLAAKLPLWPELRDALRNRRDELTKEDRLLFNGFEYFAVHGEWSDLDWLWKTAGTEDNNRRQVAFYTIKKLLKRLNAQGE